MLKKLSLVIIYLFVFALFTSMALLSVYGGLALLASLALFSQAAKDRKLNITRSQFFLFSYIVIALLSIAVNSHESTLKVQYGTLLRMLLGCTLVYFIRYIIVHAKETHHWKRLLLLFLAVTTLAHLSGIIGWLTGYNPLKFKISSDPHRATGMYGQAIAYANSTQFLLLVYFGLLLNFNEVSKYVKKFWLQAATTLAAIGFMLALTRGAILGFIMALPFLFINSSKAFFMKSIFSLIVLLAILFLVMFSVSRDHRLSIYSKSSQIRLSQYSAAIAAFKEKPLLGLGFGQFSHQVERIKKQYDLGFKKFIGHAHSNYFEALASTGLIGIAVFLLFLWNWLQEIRKIKSSFYPLYLSVWVAFVISGAFQNTFTDAENMHILFFIYACTQFEFSEGQIMAKQLNELKSNG